MSLTRRSFIEAGAPLLLLPHKSGAQAPILNNALLEHAAQVCSHMYVETLQYGYASKETYRAAGDIAGAVITNGSSVMALARQMNVTAAHAQSLDEALASTVHDNTKALGWQIPSPDMLFIGSEDPPSDRVTHSLQSAEYMNTLAVSLSAGLAAMGALSPVTYAMVVRDLDYERVHYRARRTHPKIVLVADSGIQKKAIVGTASGAVLVSGGTSLITASGITAATLTTASVTSVALFSFGTALIVIGVGLVGYWGWQAVKELAAGSSSGQVSDVYGLIPAPPQHMLGL